MAERKQHIHQLGHRPTGGRAAFVRELGELLADSPGAVLAISALAGIGGVGKTTLAVHVAHQAHQSFPDGQLYVDLQGAGARPTEPETVLGSFLRALGMEESAIPDSLEERSALYRSALNGRRVLLLLDNARDAAQVRPLIPSTEGCATLVTSRVRMVDLAGAHLVDLDVMSPDEALQLFTRIVGSERVQTEHSAALDVVAACGFLPLAIRIAASRLAARRTWTVSVLAAKLSDERPRPRAAYRPDPVDRVDVLHPHPGDLPDASGRAGSEDNHTSPVRKVPVGALDQGIAQSCERAPVRQRQGARIIELVLGPAVLGLPSAHPRGIDLDDPVPAGLFHTQLGNPRRPEVGPPAPER